MSRKTQSSLFTTTVVKRKLEILHRRNERTVEQLAEDVRRRLITPFCEKYGLDFTSGMGSYGFDTVTDELLTGWDSDLHPYGGAFNHIEEWAREREAEGEAPRGYAKKIAVMMTEIRRVHEVLDLDAIGQNSLGEFIRDVRYAEIAK